MSRMPFHPSPSERSISVRSNTWLHHAALVSASRAENEVCEIFEKLGIDASGIRCSTS
jgi:hypothetical protein